MPWAEPHVGAIATQSYANPRYGPDGLALLREGLAAGEVVERLTAADDGRAQRQLGVVDGEGRAATFTGDGCHAWAGGRTGDGYAAQGNILVSGATVDALAETFEATAGRPLAERLLDCLDAAQAAGGDRRGRSRRRCSSSSATAATRASPTRSSTCASTTTRDPLAELRRLHRLHDELFGTTPREDGSPSTTRFGPRSTSASRASATLTSPRGQGWRTSRSASTAWRPSTRLCSRRLREAT